MKGLILAGGTGSRIRPFSLHTAKQLLPVLNKPVLFHNIDLLLAGGIYDIGLVVGPMKEHVIKAVNDSIYSQLANICFINQPDPQGLAHAVFTSQSFLEDDDFIMILGDNFFTISTNDLINTFKEQPAEALVALIQVNEPERYGIAVLENNQIVSVIEKPKSPPSNLALAGLYIFRSTIHKIIENLQPSYRNEYEITDAIQELINKGQPVIPYFLKGYWRDIGTIKDLFETNMDLLQNIKPENSQISYLETTSTKICPPVLIDKTAVILNSFIGPNAIIGAATNIINSKISNSIVLENTTIDQADTENTIFSPWGNKEVTLND